MTTKIFVNAGHCQEKEEKRSDCVLTKARTPTESKKSKVITHKRQQIFRLRPDCGLT